MITKYTTQFEDGVKTANEISRAARDKAEQVEVSNKSTKCMVDALEAAIAEANKRTATTTTSAPAFCHSDPWHSYNKSACHSTELQDPWGREPNPTRQSVSFPWPMPQDHSWVRSPRAKLWASTSATTAGTVIAEGSAPDAWCADDCWNAHGHRVATTCHVFLSFGCGYSFRTLEPTH